ncbi:MAG TPA: prepilin-type N-terminal cleavage/methylation domain-containing protein [Bacteriovoracaceae bacterium]|nr:prepilin-type N-terminal cleavage/methylation domain-containing protein [Bacteriovoracaceae bacterium]
MAQGLRNLREKGFSLLEVMIAFALFAFFISAFLTAQGYNVSDSTLSEEQLMLQQLCERKINELILDPPKFTNATANTKETKTFEGKDYENYEYTLEIKKIVLPDFSQLFAQKGGASAEGSEAYDGDYYDDGNKGKRNAAVEKLIFDELKKNIEKIIWQARVTVTNKDTKYNFSLSTFITNHTEKVQLNVAF